MVINYEISSRFSKYQAGEKERPMISKWRKEVFLGYIDIMLLHTSCEPNDDDEVRKEGKEKKKEKLSVHNP